jgi:hypothetical protein
MFRFLFV